MIGLLGHPRFAATVDSIVVEFGNARFQARVDRYIAGGDVSPKPGSTDRAVGELNSGAARLRGWLAVRESAPRRRRAVIVRLAVARSGRVGVFARSGVRAWAGESDRIVVGERGRCQAAAGSARMRSRARV